MELNTFHFGKITYDVKKEILFKEGVPGFEELKRYIMIEDEDIESPFCYLQSVEDGEVSFIMMNPYDVKADYAPSIPEICFKKLGDETDEYVILSIVAIPQDIQSATINLQAPLLINLNTRRGMQVILEDATYQTRHRLMTMLHGEDE